VPLPLIYLITDLELGGLPLLLRSRALAIARLGDFAPHVVSLANPGPVGRMMQEDGINVTGLGARRVADLPQVLWRWVRLLRRTRPAVVQSMLVHANALAALGAPLGPPAVYLQELHTTQPRPRWQWTLQGRIAGRAAAVLAPTQQVLDMIAQHGRYKQGIVVPNGIAVARFRDAVVLPAGQRPWPPGARVVGYVGRFDVVKRLNILIESMVDLSRRPATADVCLALVGYGREQAALQTLARRLGVADKVFFPGPTTAPEQWYKSFTIMCLPSEAEGMPMVLLESLAAGIPVVASDIPAIRALVQEGQGVWLFDSSAKTSLTAVLASALENLEERQLRAAAGQKWVDGALSLEAVAAEHNKILKNFCTK